MPALPCRTLPDPALPRHAMPGLPRQAPPRPTGPCPALWLGDIDEPPPGPWQQRGDSEPQRDDSEPQRDDSARGYNLPHGRGA